MNTLENLTLTIFDYRRIIIASKVKDSQSQKAVMGMGITDSIAKLIEEMLGEADGNLELRRNDLAQKVGCVPSQINYVISSRFTPERGYIIESKRGGGGYIRIIRRQIDRNQYLMHFFCAIGENIDLPSAEAFIGNLGANKLITERERKLASLALNAASDDTARAGLLRQIVLTVMS